MVAQYDCAVIMWDLLVLALIISHVCSEGLPPPVDVHVDSLLQWSAPPGHHNASFTVQYLSVNQQWHNISSCVQSQSTSCDVTAPMKEGEFGCVRLRVFAHEHSLASDSVEACSQQGTSCSPEVQLSSQPGTLTVNLNQNHRLFYRHGSQIKHLVYFAKEGEPLQEYGYSQSSVVMEKLEEGKRYCASVSFVAYGNPLGPPSCVKCQDIPQSEELAKPMAAILGVVFSVTVAVVMLLLVYVLLFQGWRIKKWMWTPTPHISGPLSVQHQHKFTYIPSEECCDHVSVKAHQPSA